MGRGLRGGARWLASRRPARGGARRWGLRLGGVGCTVARLRLLPGVPRGAGQGAGPAGDAVEARLPRDDWLGPATGKSSCRSQRPARYWEPAAAACACEMRPRAVRTRAAAPAAVAVAVAAVAAKADAASSAPGARCMRTSTRALGNRRPCRRLHKHLFRTRSPR
jgi:hypothetical protein